MPLEATLNARLLSASDVGMLRDILAVFGQAFEDEDTYSRKQPTDEYLKDLLCGGSFIAIAGCAGESVVGGLAGYILRKFEQERSEIYIYDLAVLEKYR